MKRRLVDPDDREGAEQATPEPDYVDRRPGYAHGASAWGDAPRRDIEPVEEVLDTVLGKLTSPARRGLRAITADWERATGPAWSQARPVKLDGGTLVVEVPDGMTASRLQFDAHRVVGVLGDPVRRVRFRVARGRS